MPNPYDGKYELLLVLPDICRPYYLTLTPAQQRTVKAEVVQVIKDTIDIDKLEDWEHVEIMADQYGYKPEDQIRQELEVQVYGLGKYGMRLSIDPSPEPVFLGYDKQFDCGLSCHHVYSLHIAGPSGPFVPWIIPSTTYPQVLMEMRVSLMWVYPRRMSGVVIPQAMMIPQAKRGAGTKARATKLKTSGRRVAHRSGGKRPAPK